MTNKSLIIYDWFKCNLNHNECKTRGHFTHGLKQGDNKL